MKTCMDHGQAVAAGARRLETGLASYFTVLLAWSLVAISLLCFAAVADAQQQYRFRTVAGGLIADGPSATQAGLQMPTGLAFDAAGNLYIAQHNENRIRKVTPAGVISTVVGNSAYGYTGDGGSATSARLANPLAVAFDATGNLYVSDSANNRVRKISASGTITTFAGNGQSTTSGDGGAATSAGINRPYGLVFDAAGNLYVADSLGNRVRKIATNGVISTVAGNGSAGFDGDGGAATNASLNQPTGLAMDSQGNLLIADALNHRIRRVTPAGIISTLAGNGSTSYTGDGGPAASAGMFMPYAVSVDTSDNVYLGDGNCAIRKVGTNGTISSVVGGGGLCVPSGDGGPAVNAGVDLVEAIAFDRNGNLYFSDSSSGRVRRVVGGVMQAVAGVGSFHGDGGAATGAVLSSAQGVAIAPDGSVYIADSYINNRVRVVAPNGLIGTVAGDGSMERTGDGVPALQTGVLYPRGVALDRDGNLYIAERLGNRVSKVTPEGVIYKVAGGNGLGFGGDGGLATDAKLSRPGRVAFDAVGNLYIADTNNHRIRKVGAAGIITTVAGNGAPGFAGDGGPAVEASLYQPSAMAFDAAGNMYIADYGNLRIRKVTPAGMISTVAGNGTGVASGNGGPATNAGLSVPTGIALDAAGNLFIAGVTLRKVASDGTISTIWGMSHYGYDVAVDRHGAIYVATLGGRILKGGLIQPAPADFDGNGFSDVLWRHRVDGRNTYWPAANYAAARNLTAASDRNWKVAGSGDFNGDGVSDVLWRNDTTGASAVWRSASYATSSYLTTITDLAWKIAGVGDFDGDGMSDVLWRHAQNGKNAIWRGGISTHQQSISGVPDLAWKIVAIGDFNGDGVSDILWRHATTGANAIWRSAKSALGQMLTTITDQGWQVAGTGDFDGDGLSDILWHHKNGYNALWPSGRYDLAYNLTTITDARWQIQAIGDYNGDSKSDILWRRSDTGSSTIWKSGNSADLQAVTGVTDANWQIVD